MPPPPTTFFSIDTVTHKIRQICFIYKGRKPRNKKTKGAADNQQNALLCKAESREPGFLDNKSSVHAPSRFKKHAKNPLNKKTQVYS
jgi:hypothetical protein